MNRTERKERIDKRVQARLASPVEGRGQILTPLFLCDLCVLCG
jgi:hypothetical protein